MKLTPIQRILVSSALLLLIGFADYHISPEISTAVFYLFPLVIFSYQNSQKFWLSILFSLVTAIAWSWVDYHTHPYTQERNLLLNWLSRYVLFFITAFATNRYFTERKLKLVILGQQKELTQKNAELFTANKELNKFVGMAAHDIRNPVGAIQMMTDLILEDETLSPDNKKWVDMIKTSATNSLQILNDTLNISQIQSGTIQLNISQTEYLKFIQDSLVMNKHLADKKNQTIVFETSIETVLVSIDKARLLQVVNNLLTNAIKYSNLNTSITVKVAFTDASQTQIQTQVIDQGLGIDEKFHTRLFDPFTTTDNKPTNNESKTGLGLAIVKKIVELHQGSIGFTSEVSKGSNFFFTIPVNQK